MKTQNRPEKLILCTNQNCEYTWKSKVLEPKCCPRCRQYIKRVDKGNILNGVQ